jgi:hypothetical protein
MPLFSTFPPRLSSRGNAYDAQSSPIRQRFADAVEANEWGFLKSVLPDADDFMSAREPGLYLAFCAELDAHTSISFD